MPHEDVNSGPDKKIWENFQIAAEDPQNIYVSKLHLKHTGKKITKLSILSFSKQKKQNTNKKGEKNQNFIQKAQGKTEWNAETVQKYNRISKHSARGFFIHVRRSKKKEE